VRTARYVVPVLFLAAVSGYAGEAKPAEAGKGARISIDPESFDFGQALPQKTLTKEFTVRNFGTEDLVIERVSTTCGCTVADGYSKTVKPGETTTLRVRLETRNSVGRLERKVVVKSNDAEKAMAEVTVTATVQAEEKPKN
jgi:Protein of unknown function (DUF1573)